MTVQRTDFDPLGYAGSQSARPIIALRTNGIYAVSHQAAAKLR